MPQPNSWTLLAALALGVPLTLGSAAASETGFLNRKVPIGPRTYRFQVYVPPDWDRARKWPVILFLHGAGERGDDGLIQTEVGIGGALRRHVDRFPAVVVMPQCRREVWWQDPEMESMALAALEQAMQEFGGDPARVYLTGLSMGGYGTWALGTKHPKRFAALAPICGGIRWPSRATPEPPAESSGEDPYADAAKKIGATPVWAFHGSADNRVPVTESRKMVEALKAAGGNVRYTEYEGVGHNSWDRAYREAELSTWLFSQRR